jgi:hypothetical protein
MPTQRVAQFSAWFMGPEYGGPQPVFQVTCCSVTRAARTSREMPRAATVKKAGEDPADLDFRHTATAERIDAVIPLERQLSALRP